MARKSILIQNIIDSDDLILVIDDEDGSELEKITYRDILVSPDGNYYLGINEGIINQDGDREGAEIILVKAGKKVNLDDENLERLEDFEIMHRQEMKRPMEADINNSGEAVIYESIDDQRAKVIAKDSIGKNKFVKTLNKSLNTVGISEKGEVIIVPSAPWSEISLFDSEGNERWTIEKPDNFGNFYEVKFKAEKDRINLINPHDNSQLNVDYSGEVKQDESQKDFYGKYNDFHQAFRNKNYEKVEKLFSQLIESEKKDRVSVESIYDRMAESQYKMDNHLKSIKYWKKAAQTGDLSVSKIKRMRKPFRALVRSREDYDSKEIMEQWNYFRDNFEPYINANDKSRLEEIKGWTRMEKETLKDVNLNRKNGIVRKVCNYIAIKPGGKGYNPQRLDFYNSEGEKVDEEEFDQKLSSVIPTSEGFVVQSGDYPELELIYFNEKLERCNSFSSDNHLSVSPGHRKILAWDKNEGELHIFGPQKTNSLHKIFSGWEKGVEIKSKYGKGLGFEVSHSDEGTKVDTDNEGESAFEPSDTHPLRGMSYLNGYIYVGYGQHLFRLEPTENSLEYVDQLDFGDDNWVNYVRTIQEEVILGRYEGEIWSIKPEMKPETRVDVNRKINYQTFSMASEDNEKVFGINGGREDSEVVALNSDVDSWVEELSTSTEVEVFTSDKFFGYSAKDSVKVYNYDFEEVFSQRYASKIRCDTLGNVLCVSGEKLRFYKLNS